MSKLAIITRFFPDDYFGGGESVAYNIWQMAKQDYDVSLISGWVHDPKLLPPGTHPIDLRSKNKLVRYWNLYSHTKRYLKEIKPDIVYSNTMEIPNTKIPSLVMVHHIGHLIGTTGKSSLINRIQLSMVKRKLRNVTQIVTVSEATKSDLIKIGINRYDIKVIHNGIDINKFIPKDVKNKKFTIMLPSRLSREKGQHIAIEALKQMPPDIVKQIKLQLVGFVSDQGYVNELKQLAKDLPVEIKTNVPKIEEYYRNANLIIFPTLMAEGFGLVAGEALCCEKPVIASNFPAIREIVRDNGILIKPGDIAMLRDSIIELFYNPKKRKRFGINGRDFVLDNFTWDIAYEKYRAIFESLLKKKPV